MTEREWPVALRGVVESVISTPGLDDRWNVAALGLHAGDDHDRTDPVRARTWGQTRTRASFERHGCGYVQFVRDPVTFVKAALDEVETDDPVLDAATAWVEVAATRVDTGESGGTQWIDWLLRPRKSAVEQRRVPTTSRSLGAVVELTVAASRLGVPEYDGEQLRDRMAFFADVAYRCGGPREREAVALVVSLSEWDPETDRVDADLDAATRTETECTTSRRVTNG
ncbi:DUF447 domain-containing protein [Halobellus sp. GM3]|uniref:DUF447 domain-containing protein n=1 Tax=Halobellus sp. GM3 TaxID=3458410 RepID=UPI00403DA9A7